SPSHPAIVSVWDTTTGGHVLSLEAHARHVSVVAISPDGEYVAIASSRPVTVRVWRARDGTCLGIFTEHSVEVSHIMFSRDGKTLCSASEDGYVCIRQMRDIV
ncbi:WD40 repeat-like protein, partial [Polyporus arcularius HHB13444]